jgi:hypothetical protein
MFQDSNGGIDGKGRADELSNVVFRRQLKFEAPGTFSKTLWKCVVCRINQSACRNRANPGDANGFRCSLCDVDNCLLEHPRPRGVTSPDPESARVTTIGLMKEYHCQLGHSSVNGPETNSGTQVKCGEVAT